MTPEERERQIQIRMERSGMSRESAALAVAIAAGELTGDVIVMPDGAAPPDSDEK